MESTAPDVQAASHTSDPVMGSSEGVHAKLRADISNLLVLIEKSPLPAAAEALVTLHELLDAHLEAAAGADASHDATWILRELAPDFGRALKRSGVLEQQQKPSQSAAPGSMTRVQRSAVATTLMIVQRVAGMPEGEALKLLLHLKHIAPICLQLAAIQLADDPPELAAPSVHSAARLAFSAASEGRGLLDVQHPLLQLAERCRVGVDADVADMRRRAASSHQDSGPSDPTSVWAVPLGMVMQALGMCVMRLVDAEPELQAGVLAGIDSLLALEAVPLGTRAEADFEYANGIYILLHGNYWDDWPSTPQVMNRLGRAVERVCKQLPEAGSGQDPSRGAACTEKRLGDLACCAMNVLRKLLPESLPTGPSSLRQFGSSVAAALQRVCGLLHRPGRSMPLPVETSLFWAAHFLALASLSVVRIAVAAGVEALEQKHVQAALLAMTRFNKCPQPVLNNYWRAAAAERDPNLNPKKNETQVMNGFAECAAIVSDALDAMLEAVAVFPHTVAMPALLSTVCTAANMHFGSAQMESWYMLAHSVPRADCRVDFNCLREGAALVMRLLNSYGVPAEDCLGGACAGALMAALTAAVAPGMPPPEMREVHSACVTLEAVLRWGTVWPARDTQQPDSREHVARSWAAFSQRLAQVAREPITKQEEAYHDLVFDKMLDQVDLVLETSEQQLKADSESRYEGMSPSEAAGYRTLSSSQHR